MILFSRSTPIGAVKPNFSMLLAIARSCCGECFRGLLGFGMMESIGMWMIASRSNAEGEVAMPRPEGCCLVVLRIKALAASSSDERRLHTRAFYINKAR